MNLTMRPPLGAEQETHSLAGFLRNEYEARLRAYSAQPRDAVEHYETENDVLSGGYAYRQLFELVQNAADAILEEGRGAGRIHVRLARGVLVAVNTGAPLDEDGIVALLNARSSSKRGGQIGRFGRKDADIKRQRGRNWTRFSPLRGALLQAILQTVKALAWPLPHNTAWPTRPIVEKLVPIIVERFITTDRAFRAPMHQAPPAVPRKSPPHSEQSPSSRERHGDQPIIAGSE